MKKYDTVVFDMDGTLLNTLEDLKNATNYALREFGMPEHSLDDVRHFVGNGVKRLMELAVPDGLNNPQFDEVFATFREYYTKHSNDTTCAYDGVVDLMKQLQEAGYALAIVSNKLDAAVKDLNEIYFEGVVKVAIGEREGVSKKPAPDMVYTALAELGRTKETAVYVGDSEVDLQTAKNAGLPCISVLWGFREHEFLEAQGAKTFAEKPADVWEILQREA